MSPFRPSRENTKSILSLGVENDVNGSSPWSGQVKPGSLGCNCLQVSTKPALSRIGYAGLAAALLLSASELKSPANITGTSVLPGPLTSWAEKDFRRQRERAELHRDRWLPIPRQCAGGRQWR